MTMIFSAIILLACTVHLGRCVTLELYSGQQYSGFLKQATLADYYDERQCTQFDETYEVRSLKTDKCVMIYETGDCKHIDGNAPGNWAMYSVRVEGNTERFDIDGAYSYRKDERGVRSFRTCNRGTGGGPTLDIDINSGTTYTGDVLASYGGVCKCENIPSNIVTKGKYLSIDNHGNSIYFYDKEDCTGLQRLITAGDNERSRSVFQFNTHADVIRSFRPVDDLSCPPLLDATIFGFRNLDVKTGGITDDVHNQITTTVTNTRLFPATVYFNTSAPITVKYSVAKTFTYLNTTRLRSGFEMEFENKLTVLLGGNTEVLRRSIEANYMYTNTNQGTGSGTINVTIPAQDQGSIDMDACEACELTYFVRRVPISYNAAGKVTGDDKLSQDQLFDLLPPGMEYEDTGSGGIIYVQVEGEMRADFLVRDPTKKVCKLAPDCRPN